MSTPLFPLSVWQSGTNENSIPANDNALRVQVLMAPAIDVADSEPGSPSEDDIHVIGTPWGGFTENNVVIYKGGVWLEWEAFEGWVKVIDGQQYYFDGADWILGGGGSGIPDAPSDGNTYGRRDGEWEQISAGSETLSIITEASSFTADPSTHAGLSRYIHAGGDVTFDSAEGYTAGEVYNIRATASLELVEDGVTLSPSYGGTLELEAGMAVTVVMTSPTAADVIGLTVQSS